MPVSSFGTDEQKIKCHEYAEKIGIMTLEMLDLWDPAFRAYLINASTLALAGHIYATAPDHDKRMNLIAEISELMTHAITEVEIAKEKK